MNAFWGVSRNQGTRSGLKTNGRMTKWLKLGVSEGDDR